MKKRYLIILMVTLSMILSPSCNQNDRETDKTLDFFHFKETLVDGLESINKAFMEDTENIRVSQEMIATEYNTVLRSRINAGNTPDIFVTGTTSQRSLQEYLDDGLIADLSGLEIISRLPQEITDPLRFEDGSIYVLPFLNTARGIIYNTQIFEQAGITQIPMTLSELEQACLKIEELGITPFAIAGSEGWSLGSIPWQVAQEAFSDGEWIESMWAGEGSFSDNAMPAFDFFDLMVRFGNENPINMNFTDQVLSFATGQSAMMAQGPWAIDTAIELEPEMADIARMMAIPVSEDPAKTRLYFDNDLYLLISSEADLELVDKYFIYIYEGRGREIFSQEVRELNAFGIEFESHMVNESITEYLERGDIVTNFQYNNMPEGFWQANANVMQSYLIGEVDRQGALDMLDSQWRSMTR